MRFLLRQGLALRGHTEKEGNLPQLLNNWSEDDEILKGWFRYMSHEMLNEHNGEKVFANDFAKNHKF